MSHDSAPHATAAPRPTPPGHRRGGVPPLHERIAGTLRDAIVRGVYPAGSKLPTEVELSLLHGAGRGTIRAALQALEAEGLVSSRQGSGRVVLDAGVSQSFDELRSFAQWARATGRVPGGRFVARVPRAAAPTEAAALQVAVGSDVLYSIRLRTLDGAPIFVERCTYPGWLAATIAQLDENCPSVTAEVRRLTGTVAVTGAHTLDLARADATDAELLGCQPGDPVLRRRAVTRRADGTPCDYTDDHYLEGTASFTLRNSVTTNVLSRYVGVLPGSRRRTVRDSDGRAVPPRGGTARVSPPCRMGDGAQVLVSPVRGQPVVQHAARHRLCARPTRPSPARRTAVPARRD